MAVAVRRQIVDWLDSTDLARQVLAGDMATIHVSDLLGDLPNGSAGIEAVLAALSCAADVLEERQARARVSAAFPCGVTVGLDTATPALDPLEFVDEPPSLYLIMAEHDLRWVGDREEYCLAYGVHPWSDSRFVAEYRCGRSLADKERGWEFSRTVWIHVPAGPRALAASRGTGRRAADGADLQ